jgi:ParB-like chromosome segregation protein Spo0J
MITQEIPIEKIVENPYQMRESSDKEAIKILAKSIRERGLYNPITVLKRKR